MYWNNMLLLGVSIFRTDLKTEDMIAIREDKDTRSRNIKRQQPHSKMRYGRIHIVTRFHLPTFHTDGLRRGSSVYCLHFTTLFYWRDKNIHVAAK